MKLLLLLISLLLLTYFNLYAQQDFPPPYLITADTASQIGLPPKYVEVLEDEQQQLTLNSLLSGQYQKEFRPSGTYNFFELHPGVYWYHYRLKNATGTPIEVALPAVGYLSQIFARKEGETWQKKQTGFLVPWNSRSGYKDIKKIPFLLPAGKEMEVYQKENYWHMLPKQLGITISFSNKILTQDYFAKPLNDDNLLLSSIISGILLFAAVTNLRFFWIIREQFYVQYSLFLLGFALLYSPITYFLREYPYTAYYVSNLCWLIALFFFVHFFRFYFRTFENYKRWDVWLVIVSFIPFVSFSCVHAFPGLLSPRTEYYFLMWGNKTYLLLLDSLLITSILYIGAHKTTTGIVATLPPLIFWGLGQSYKVFFTTLYEYNSNLHVPALVNWVNENNYLIDLLSVFWIVSVFSSALFHRFQQLQKQNLEQAVENERLEKQKEIERRELIAQQKELLEQQVEERTTELKESLEELKATQGQLIQREKMASLGELTAGIAHEIQNPLNFVNNFSEVSSDLTLEMEEEMKKGNMEEVMHISNDIRQNLDKIIQHGKRADAIVKGMLLHSRKSTGEKEQVDINALVDEYLRLSYHGLRAKDKTFNAMLETNFDKSAGNITVIPQDIGRVLLNLFSNAFYSVTEKKKLSGSNYNPVVSVSTKKEAHLVEIRIWDNGTGIPQDVVEKIYQPFFTTKPTGQGTGLGLSLSYDVITKAHRGTLTVNTKEGEYAEFIIHLPVA